MYKLYKNSVQVWCKFDLSLVQVDLSLVQVDLSLVQVDLSLVQVDIKFDANYYQIIIKNECLSCTHDVTNL